MEIKKRFYYKIPQDLSFLELEMSIVDLETTTDGSDIWIFPNAYCGDKEIQLLNSAKTGHEQKKIYKNLGYWQTFLHEGCYFGLNYAFDTPILKQNEQKSLKIKIRFLKWNSGATHDLAAYVSIKLFWDLINFKPNTDEDVYYSLKRKRFIFPRVTKFPIGQRTIEELDKVFSDIKETDKEVFDGIVLSHKAFEREYFDR